MRFLLALLTVSALLSGCGMGLPSQPMSGTWPPPAFGGSWSSPATPKVVEASCPERLTEPACKQAESCRWLAEHKRSDGTLASAYCTGP